MTSGAVVLGVFMFIWMLKWAANARERNNPGVQSSATASVDAQVAAEAPRTRLQERSLPLHQRVIRAVGGRIFARWLKSIELQVEVDSAAKEIRVVLFCPRRVFYFDVFVPPALGTKVNALKIHSAGGDPISGWGLQYHEDGNRTRIRISLPRKELVANITLGFSASPGDFSWEVQVRVVNEEYRDYDLLLRILRDRQGQHAERARESCLEYMQLCDHNPTVLIHLGSIHADRAEADKAGLYFIRSVVSGFPESGLKKYADLQEKRPWRQHEDLQRLCTEADGWELAERHGAVVLSWSEECVLGLQGWYLRRCSETLRIRRASAGRLMNNPRFSVGSGERLIHTRARCIASDGTARELPEERFTYREDPDADPTITTRVERTGSWILPDLEVGDVVEWSYDLLCKEHRPGEPALKQSFIVSHPANSFFPTLEGSVTVSWREHHPPLVQINNVHDGLNAKDTQEDEWHSRRFDIRKYVPRQSMGAPYHRYLMNPVVTCATLQQDWNAVAGSVSRHCFGPERQEEPLPAPLARIASESVNATEAMRTAFYWTRDNLKYASLQSAESNIGGTCRAESIIQAGVGDCKDRAYLLHLMAHHLGIPDQYLFVSTKYGVVFEDVPADQFDHVFVRVQLDGRWRYLDATNEKGVFGSVPLALQGLKALAIAEVGEVIPLPIDSPVDNTLEVVEAFESVNSGWLYGTFYVRLEGSIARLADCNLKRASLHMNDQEAAAQHVLRNYLPTLELHSLACVSETSCSDVLELAGTQRRCHLAELGSLNVGFVTWSEPSLPFHRTLDLDLHGVFGFSYPMQLKYQAVFHGKVFHRLHSWSPPLNFSNRVGTITSTEEKLADRLSIGRTVMMHHKYAEGPRIHDVKTFMDTLERALQVAVAFYPAEATAKSAPSSDATR